MSMTSSPTKERTDKQNKALHLYLTLVSDALDREGVTMQDVCKAIRRAEIRPSKNALKEVVWRPLQTILVGKKSTKDLETNEVDKVYEAMNKWLGTEFGIHVPFPSIDSLMDEHETQQNIIPH